MADLTFGAFVAPIKDMSRAVEFYSGVLGLGVRQQGDMLSILETGNAQLWLLDYQGRLEPSDGPTQVIFFVSEGVDDYEQRVREAGCRFREEIHDDPFGRLFIFIDSEGSSVEIRQPSEQVTG